jgi:cell division protein FtsW (lipid II flippase)
MESRRTNKAVALFPLFVAVVFLLVIAASQAGSTVVWAILVGAVLVVAAVAGATFSRGAEK